MKKVILYQPRLLHYRTQLFTLLQKKCLEHNIDLHVIHGQASRRELPKKDQGKITAQWVHEVKNIFLEVGDRDMVWQPPTKLIKNAELIIIMQENRIISNYLFFFIRRFFNFKVAYWGHGINFQTKNPNGIREKWKNFMLTKADYWFAYTRITVDILNTASYPSNKITCLNNAIDTRSFKADLEDVTSNEISKIRTELKIEDDALVGLFCGSLYPEKRLDLLIKSSELINKRFKLHLLIIGDGPSMPIISDAAKLHSWIHVLGIKNDKEKAIYFRSADLMLNPGLVGLHIVDAFCSGLVLCTTNNAKHSPEIAYLHDGKNALVTEDHPQSYANGIIEILSNPKKLSNMKSAALKDGEVYTLEQMSNNFLSGIKNCLNIA